MFLKKHCPEVLSPRIIPYKPLKALWKTLGMVKNLTTKKLLISTTIKISFNKFTSSAIKSVIPSPSNSNFHLITLCNFHLQLYLLLLYHFFHFSGFMYRQLMQILIGGVLLNVVISMTKALYSPPTFKATQKTLLLLMLVFLFFTLLFSFQTYLAI